MNIRQVSLGQTWCPILSLGSARSSPLRHTSVWEQLSLGYHADSNQMKSDQGVFIVGITYHDISLYNIIHSITNNNSYKSILSTLFYINNS